MTPLTTIEVAEALQDLAERVRVSATIPVTISGNDMTIREADAALGSVLKTYHIDLSIQRVEYRREPRVGWKLWDGEKITEGPRLGDLVRAVVVKHGGGKPATLVEAVEAVEQIRDPNGCQHANVTDGVCDCCCATVDPKEAELAEYKPAIPF